MNRNIREAPMIIHCLPLEVEERLKNDEELVETVKRHIERGENDLYALPPLPSPDEFKLIINPDQGGKVFVTASEYFRGGEWDKKTLAIDFLKMEEAKREGRPFVHSVDWKGNPDPTLPHCKQVKEITRLFQMSVPCGQLEERANTLGEQNGALGDLKEKIVQVFQVKEEGQEPSPSAIVTLREIDKKYPILAQELGKEIFRKYLAVFLTRDPLEADYNSAFLAHPYYQLLEKGLSSRSFSIVFSECVWAKENREEVAPKIIYLGDINRPESPYAIKIDAAQLGRLFQEDLGISPETIKRTAITVQAKEKGERRKLRLTDIVLRGAEVFPYRGDPRITLFVDNFFVLAQKLRADILGYLKQKGEQTPEWKIEEIKRNVQLYAQTLGVVTKRLPIYIRIPEVSPQRTDNLLKILIPLGLRRGCSGGLIEEGIHIVTMIEGDKNFSLKIAGILTAVVLINQAIISRVLGIPLPLSLLALPIDLVIGKGAINIYQHTGKHRVSEKLDALRNARRWHECVNLKVRRWEFFDEEFK